MDASKQKSALETIKEYWVLIAVAISLIIGWTTINNKITTNEARITKLETKVELTDEKLGNIQNTVVEIKTTVEFIKVQLSNPNK